MVSRIQSVVGRGKTAYTSAVAAHVPEEEESRRLRDRSIGRTVPHLFVAPSGSQRGGRSASVVVRHAPIRSLARDEMRHRGTM